MTYEVRYDGSARYEPRVLYERVLDYRVAPCVPSRGGVARLPVVASYTVDVRLREFRRFSRDGIEIVPFESEEGRYLLFLLFYVRRA